MPLVSATLEHSELLRKATTAQVMAPSLPVPSSSMSSVASVASSSMARVGRWLKYYVLINGFICGVGLLSFHLVATFQKDPRTQLLALYVASLLRVLWMVMWFDWIATKKSKIFGAKRHVLTAAQRRAIYYRIMWLVVPTECVSYYLAQPSLFNDGSLLPVKDWPPNLQSVALEFAWFIIKSLAFEVAFDFFHYAAHWTCHEITWLYQHVHKRHHWHLHPCALSTYEQDGVDLVLTNVLPFVGASLVSPAFSPLQLHLLFAYKSYVEVAGHSGLEIKGFSFPQMPLVNVFGICLRVHDHDLHHTHPKYNFAKRFSIWDKLFHTFQPGRAMEGDTVPSQAW